MLSIRNPNQILLQEVCRKTLIWKPKSILLRLGMSTCELQRPTACLSMERMFLFPCLIGTELPARHIFFFETCSSIDANMIEVHELSNNFSSYCLVTQTSHRWPAWSSGSRDWSNSQDLLMKFSWMQEASAELLPSFLWVFFILPLCIRLWLFLLFSQRAFLFPFLLWTT